MKISKWECDVTQDPEQCSYFAFGDDRRCVVCGVPEGVGIQHHSGPELVAAGWFESPEYCESGAWESMGAVAKAHIEKKHRGLVLMPLYVTGCEPFDNGSTWRYLFRGVKMVERHFADKANEHGRTA